MQKTKKTISIITPSYNEELNIRDCYNEVRQTMLSLLPDYDYEHIFIDNCSEDRTVDILKTIASLDDRVKIIVNSRNFGHLRSPYHALMQAQGDAACIIAADLQTPPAALLDFVNEWNKGHSVIVGVRSIAHHPIILRTMRSFYYKLIAKISPIEHIKNFMGFGLYDKKVLDVLRQLNEPEPYLRGLISEIGFSRSIVQFNEGTRKHGNSRNNYLDLLDTAILGIATSSTLPLRLMVTLGALSSIATFIVGVIFLILKLIFWDTYEAGIIPIIILLCFLSSIQIAALGVIGEYIRITLNYTRRFPLVIESERINFDKK
jgi:glycosyltransferase involved in cell wall biosynthesis